VIPTTSVSRPQLKSNPKGDRVLRSNSPGKKLEVEEHRRNVKLSKNKMPITACTANLNAKTVNVKSNSAMCVNCVMTDKHDVCVTKSVAKPLRKTVASESIKKPRNNVRKLNELFGKINKWTYIKFTPSGYMWKPKSKQDNVNQNVIVSESIKKPRNNVRKLNERFGKINKWTYIKFTPSGYVWKPKSKQANVNQNVSIPLANASRTANVKDAMTSRRSTMSNTPLVSNSFATHRDCPIHRRLWVLKAHDGNVFGHQISRSYQSKSV
nr:hypothetical protein [Tanacetum cinerariifolium]